MIDLFVLVSVLGRDRVSTIIQRLHGNWELGDISSSVFKSLFFQWNKYINRTTESVQEYNTLKGRIIIMLGEDVFDWLRDYTTLLTRTVILDGKGVHDDIVTDNMIELVDL